MYFFNVILLIAVLVTCASTARYSYDKFETMKYFPHHECNPGTIWTPPEDDCLRCYCSPIAFKYCQNVCTSVQEGSESKELPSYKTVAPLLKRSQECTPGEVIRADICNRCYCIAPDWIVCTDLCMHDESLDYSQDSDLRLDDKEAIKALPRIVVSDDASECKPGETVGSGCSECFCIAPGWLACTGLCLPSKTKDISSPITTFKAEREEKSELLTKISRCKVGKIVKEDCHDCLCTSPNRLSCVKRDCLRGRQKLAPFYQPTPVPSEIRVQYKKLGFATGQCPVGQVITTNNCSICTCVLKGIMVCSKQHCDKKSKKKKDLLEKLFHERTSTLMPILEYEPEYYDTEL